MRWLFPLVCLALGASVAEARPFLGVQMHDLGPQQGAGPCVIEAVTKGTGAELAGLRPGDVFATIAGTEIAACSEVIKVIQSRDPGELVAIGVRRNGLETTIKANLYSIDEILRRRYVGRLLPSAQLISVEDRSESDFGAQRGKTTIISWFSPGTCEGCTRVLDKVVRWQKTQPAKGAPISVVSATSDRNKTVTDNLESMKKLARSLDVPLFVTDFGTYDQFTLAAASGDRINFMVVDQRGVVQHVALIAPESDDVRASLDELYAAVEQAARRH